MDIPIASRIGYMVLSLFILIACVAFSKWRELSRMKKLNHLVAWSVTTNYRALESIRPGLDLIDYVFNVQYEHKVPTKYCISGEKEQQIAKDILKEFQRVLTQEYFNGKVSYRKSKYADNGEHFFFAHLFEFLRKHACDDKFIGIEMHANLLKRKQYGASFSSGSESTYQLSTFGVVFYKMYYLSYLFCKESFIYGDRIAEWFDPKSITDVIEKEEATICVHPY